MIRPTGLSRRPCGPTGWPCESADRFPPAPVIFPRSPVPVNTFGGKRLHVWGASVAAGGRSIPGRNLPSPWSRDQADRRTRRAAERAPESDSFGQETHTTFRPPSTVHSGSTRMEPCLSVSICVYPWFSGTAHGRAVSHSGSFTPPERSCFRRRFWSEAPGASI
jgi:hypothetical protein